MPNYAPYGNAIYGQTVYGYPPPIHIQTTMSVSPTPTNGTPTVGLYNSLFVSWVLPGGNWNQMVLVRSSFGVPISPFASDGVQLLDQTSNFNTSFTDTNLAEGRFYYYALFVFDTDINTWLQAASAQGLCLTDYQFPQLFTSWTPDWYMEQDQLLVPAAPLARFFALLGFEMNWIRSEIETLFTLNSPQYISGAMLPFLGGNVGIGYEPALGMTQSRDLISNAVQLYKTKGTNPGVAAAASLYTGYSCVLTLSPNNEIQLDDSAFDRSTGHWKVQNTATSLSLVSATALGITPQHVSYLPIQGNVGLSTGLMTQAGALGYLPSNSENVLELTAVNTTFGWAQQSGSSSVPGGAAGLTSAASAYHVPTGQTILFGGSPTGFSVASSLAQTWAFNGISWTQLNPATSPPPRSGASLAYNAATGTLILFGGISPLGVFLNDTWSWNGITWTQVALGTTNLAQNGQGLQGTTGWSNLGAFGGSSISAITTGPVGVFPQGTNGGFRVTGSTGGAFPGTWSCGIITAPASLISVIPGQAYSVAAFVQPINNATTAVLSIFWQTSSGSIQTTVQTLTGVATGGWTELSGASIIAPAGATTCQISVTSGNGTTVDQSFYFAAPTFNIGGVNQYYAEAGSTGLPPARGYHALATWSTTGVVMFGGTNSAGAVGTFPAPAGSTFLSDTWFYNGTNWIQQAPVHSPSGRFFHAMAYNSFEQATPNLANGVVVLFGGSSALSTFLADTWIWNGVDWASPAVSTVPTARVRHAMAYSVAADTIVMSAGLATPGSSDIADNWIWSGTNWKSIPINAPTWPAPQGHVMAYTKLGTVMLFGGTNTLTTDVTPTNGTWVYNASSSLWWQLDGTPTPAPRTGGAICYNTATNSVLLWGGYNNQGSGVINYLNTFWQWTAAAGWTPILPTNGVLPANAAGSQMVYTSGGVCFLYGGVGHSGGVLASAYTWNGTAWTQLTSAAPAGARVWHNMVFDAGIGKVIIFGGSTNNATPNLSDTWTYTVGTNSFAQLTPGGTIPPARMMAGLAYTQGNTSLLFGGQIAGFLPDNRTFSFSSAGAGTWTALTPTTTPPARYGHAMVFDSAKSQVFMIGGATVGLSTTPALSDTWAFTPTNWSTPSTGNWTSPVFTSTATPLPRAYANVVYNPVSNSIIAQGGSPFVVYNLGNFQTQPNDTYIGSPVGGQVYISTCDQTTALTLGIPVVQSATPQPVVLSGYFQPAPAATPTLQAWVAQLDWYGPTGAFISSSTGAPVTETATGWVRPFVSATPVNGAAYYGRTFKTVSVTMTGDLHLFDAEQVEINSLATPGPSTWRPPRDLQLNLLPLLRNQVVNGQGLANSPATFGWSVPNAGSGGSITAVATGPAGNPVWPANTQAGFQLQAGLIAGTWIAEADSIMMPCNPLAVYTASAWLQGPVGDIFDVFIRWYSTTSVGSLISTTTAAKVTTLAANTWGQNVCFNVTAPAGAQYATLSVFATGTGAAPLFYMAAPLFNEGTNIAYFDGTFSPSPDYSFEGSPNLSATSWYPNVTSRLSRLITIMPKYTPIGSTFSIYTHNVGITNAGLR